MNGHQLKTWKDIVTNVGVEVFDKKCSVVDVYKKTLTEGIKKDLSTLKHIQNIKINVLSDSQNNADVDAKFNEITHKLDTEYSKLMQLKLKEKICEGQSFYLSKNSDMKKSILLNKGF